MSTTTDISSLNYRPEFIEGQDKHNQESLKEFGETVNSQIERMQKQREGWRELLQQLYEADVIQDDKVRDLRRRVMMGEAEAMANPSFHRWLRERELHGVGGEQKIDAWYNIDSLLAHTPYLCTIPCPRNLSEKGWEMIEETVEELFGTLSEENTKNSTNDTTASDFTLEWWPVLQHQQHGTNQEEEQDHEHEEAGEQMQNNIPPRETTASSTSNPNRRTPRDSCIPCSAKKGHLKQVFDSSVSTLQRALIETPCFLIGDSATTARLSSPYSSPLLVYVVRGTLIAVEPYYYRGSGDEQQQEEESIAAKFPTYLSPTANTATNITSSNCKAILQLRSWLDQVTLESLPERSFTAVVMMTCLSSSEVAFSLLNVAPLDAVGSSNFAWSDMIGLIVNASNKREVQMSDFEREHPGIFDASNNSENSTTETRLDEALASGAVVMPTAPKVEVVFRGSWCRVDPGTITSTSNTTSSVSPKEVSTTTKKPEKSSSSFSTSTIVAIAATACVASASIGIGLGLKLAQQNSGKK